MLHATLYTLVNDDEIKKIAVSTKYLIGMVTL